MLKEGTKLNHISKNCRHLLPCWATMTSATSSKIGHRLSLALAPMPAMHSVLLANDSRHLATPCSTFSHCQTPLKPAREQKSCFETGEVCCLLPNGQQSVSAKFNVFDKWRWEYSKETDGLKHYQFILLHPSSIRWRTTSTKYEIYSTSTAYFMSGTETHCWEESGKSSVVYVWFLKAFQVTYFVLFRVIIYEEHAFYIWHYHELNRYGLENEYLPLVWGDANNLVESQDCFDGIVMVPGQVLAPIPGWTRGKRSAVLSDRPCRGCRCSIIRPVQLTAVKGSQRLNMKN